MIWNYVTENRSYSDISVRNYCCKFSNGEHFCHNWVIIMTFQNQPLLASYTSDFTMCNLQYPLINPIISVISICPLYCSNDSILPRDLMTTYQSYRFDVSWLWVCLDHTFQQPLFSTQTHSSDFMHSTFQGVQYASLILTAYKYCFITVPLGTCRNT